VNTFFFSWFTRPLGGHTYILSVFSSMAIVALLLALGALAIVPPPPQPAHGAVVLVEIGDERPHVREFVEYHLSVGFSRLYVVLGHNAPPEVRSILQSYPSDVVRIDETTRHTYLHSTDVLISHAVRDAGGAPRRRVPRRGLPLPGAPFSLPEPSKGQSDRQRFC
jgi:hypothetical protein